MRGVVVFFICFLIGIAGVFAYRKITVVQDIQKLKVPVLKSSFALDTAPSQSLKGTIASLSGDVLWQSRIATEPAQIKIPQQLQQGETLVTKDDGHASITFPNAFTATISPATTVDFVQTLPNNILLSQSKGITHYREQNAPLTIRSLGIIVQFNQAEVIITDNKTLPYVSADVIRGSITAGYNDTDSVTQVLTVTAGNRLVYDTEGKTINIISLQ